MFKATYHYGIGCHNSCNIKQLINIDIMSDYACKNVKLSYGTTSVISTIVWCIEIICDGKHINELPVNEMHP